MGNRRSFLFNGSQPKSNLIVQEVEIRNDMVLFLQFGTSCAEPGSHFLFHILGNYRRTKRPTNPSLLALYCSRVRQALSRIMLLNLLLTTAHGFILGLSAFL
jgi:hypothetical protein